MHLHRRLVTEGADEFHAARIRHRKRSPRRPRCPLPRRCPSHRLPRKGVVLRECARIRDAAATGPDLGLTERISVEGTKPPPELLPWRCARSRRTRTVAHCDRCRWCHR